MAHRQQQFTKIVLDVAGRWSAREDVVAAIAASSPGWKYAGRLLVQTATHRTFHLDVMDKEAALGSTAAQGFRYESPESHAGEPVGLRLRLTAPAGTLDMARLALEAAAALVDAGAHRLECRSSGGALEASEWRALAADRSEQALARAFVAEHRGPHGAASSGMQSLGLADAVVEVEAGGALARFTSDLIAGRLRPKEGQRFDAGAAFRLAHEPCTDVGREDPRFNPFGRWRLRSWTT